jgi:L-asparaginase II
MDSPLFELWRGGILESAHRGRFAVVSGRRIVLSKGDVDEPTFMRSSAKPFQAIAVVESGAADAYGFSEDELAVICGSHYGEEIHVKAVESILRKAGLRPSHLQCGAHAPFSPAMQKRLALAGKEPSVLHNNCSGKHSGMVAAAKRLGAPLATYLEPGHPLQKANRATLARFAGVKPASIRLGVDGCSAPTFGLSVTSMARAFAALATPDGDGAARRVVDAMTRHPQMVGHPCQELMTAAKGHVVGKVGAEGVYCAGVLGKKLDIAVKVGDGSTRPLLAVVAAILRNLRVLDAREQAAIEALVKPEIKNHAGKTVGMMKVVLG